MKKSDGAVFTAEQSAALAAWTKRYFQPRMGLIEALRDVQDWHGEITVEAEQEVAKVFGLPPTHVREVATFYPYFTQEKAGKLRVAVCRNVSCALAGAKQVMSRLEREFGVAAEHATPDGLLSWEEAECLGACDMAPAVSVNDQLQGGCTDAVLDKLLPELKKGKVPCPGLNERHSVHGPEKGVKVLTAHFDDPSLHTLDGYRKHGGWSSFEKAKGMEPAAITAEVKKSNLRGLGGAGFPVGMKWETVPPKAAKPHYVVCNFDESEPGCFKDRALAERNPHALLEGLQIASRAISADRAFIFIRGEYLTQYRALTAALEEADRAGLTPVPIQIMRGANAYISGLDTALLETMEGKKAWPRQPPPFPTVAGLFGCPTVVNNIETLMMLPHVVGLGAEKYAALGVAKSGGTAVFSVSGHVKNPGIYEFPMGAPLMDILAAAGGVREGRQLKAVIPGGTSTPILTAAEAQTAKMDFDSLRGLGTFLGAGGVIVLDDSTDMVKILFIIERFLWHESCGQCTPCREGSGWVTRILRRMVDSGGYPGDVENVLRVGGNITGTPICALGETIGPVAKTIIAKFRNEFDARIAAKAEKVGG
ncbi:MAG: NADH-quinone oxidoreductase subunit NuoF [Elusimicrobia bacterium]|nr:NADH-quinone oxidoreductase subunit NuoF [Elusimicrobiota bacterium]